MLSVLLHTLALAGILVNINTPQTQRQGGDASAAITVIAAADVPALPPWPVVDSGQNEVPIGAGPILSELRGDVPLLHTNNALPLPDTSARPPVAQEPHGATPHPAEQQQIAYGHYDPAIFTQPEEPVRHGSGNAAATQIASSPPPSQPAIFGGVPSNGFGVGEFLEGKFRVRIVTTKDNAFVVVEITGGNGMMRGLLDGTAQHYQTYAQYDESSGSQNGRFTAPVLAALP